MLFWDKIAIPENNAFKGPENPEIEFLDSCGFVERPYYSSSGDMATIVAESYAHCFATLETKHPGAWSTSGERSDFHFSKLDMEKQRGALVKLTNAIPVPERDVPLEDVFEFKFKRRDELELLRLEVDGFFDSWLGAQDKDHQLKSNAKRIATTCNELIRVAKESKISFRAASWGIGYSLTAIASYTFYDFLEEGSFDERLLGINTAMAGFGAGLALMAERTPKTDHWKSSAYRYDVRMENELF